MDLGHVRVLESRLVSMAGATEIGEFEASTWHNSREFASGTFRSVNSKAAYWPNTSSQQIVAAALQMRRK